jgi:excisionase family DNA binding protein
LTTSTDKFAPPFNPSDWITQAEAARLRNVTRQAIARLVGNGRLRTLDIGGRSFVNRSDVLAFEPNPPGRPKATNHD